MKVSPKTSGIGLRLAHLSEMVATRPRCSWLEIHPENFLANPHAKELLVELSSNYPMFISGHLAWSSYQNEYLNDLLPMPYNEETLEIVVGHVHRVQEMLSRPYLLENPASYVAFRSSTIPETEFLAEIVARTGCQLLCDVSNIVVSAHNLGYDARGYVDDLPPDKIGEIHLGGYTAEEDEATPGAKVLIDTHAAPIARPAWDLYAYALRRFGPKPTLIEWDNDMPRLSTLLGEVVRSDEIQAQICHA